MGPSQRFAPVIAAWDIFPAFPEMASTPATSPPDPLLGTTVGSFRLVRRIGHGGMGSVYLGEQTLIGSKVAVKVLHEHLASDASLVQRFYAEARAVNLIGHPNIVNIFDMNVVPPRRYYLIMEYLEGEPLSAAPAAPMAPERALPILIQVCQALQAAHARGVVHRDLKPENIFLCRRDGPPFVKILDFGIAKLFGGEMQEGQTHAGWIVGTPEYMAPEQGAGDALDGRADIYALGVIAYRLATGRLPFTGGGVTGVLLAHRDTPAAAAPRAEPAGERRLVRGHPRRAGQAARGPVRGRRRVPGRHSSVPWPAPPRAAPRFRSRGARRPPVPARACPRRTSPTRPPPPASPPRPPASAERCSSTASRGRSTCATSPVPASTPASPSLSPHSSPGCRSRSSIPQGRSPRRRWCDRSPSCRPARGVSPPAWRCSSSSRPLHSGRQCRGGSAASRRSPRPRRGTPWWSASSPAPGPPPPTPTCASESLRTPEFDDIRSRWRELRTELEGIHQRGTNPGQQDEARRLLAKLNETMERIATPARRVETDAEAGNYRGVARCIAAGLTVTALEQHRARFLGRHPAPTPRPTSRRQRRAASSRAVSAPRRSRPTSARWRWTR